MKVVHRLPVRARSTPATRVRRFARPTEELETVAKALQRPAELSPDGRLVVQVKTRLPTDHGVFDVRLFQFDGDPREHLAISKGELAGETPLAVRIHSECFTGEVLHSQRCECGQQLGHALDEIERAGRGLVIYLRQEGRGIGLANKLRAYALQELGADTVDANRLLGLPDDARTYEMAAALLKHLGVTRLRLLTNNPAKREGLEQHGIEVVDRVPVLVASNPIAAQYLATKRDRMRHEVPDAAVDELLAKPA